MKVLFFLSDLSGGGAERTAINLVQCFHRNQVNVKIGMLWKRGAYLSSVNAEDLTDLEKSRFGNFIYKIPYGGRFLSNVLMLRKIVKKEKPDLIVSFTYEPHITLYFFKLFFKKTCWILREGNNAREALKRKVEKYLYGLAVKKADGIIAISEGVKANLVDAFFATSETVEVIYNPVNLNFIASESAKYVKLPAERFVVAAGRLHKQKGFDVLIDAFSHIAGSMSIDLVIVGQGELKMELEKQIKDLNLEGRVHLVGFKENPWAYIAGAEVFVLSSLYEGFGNVVVEAMACKVPVIASDCNSGPNEILMGGKYGLLFPVGDVTALTKHLNQLLSDDGLRNSLIASGFSRSKDFEDHYIAQKYEKYFAKVIKDCNV